MNALLIAYFLLFSSLASADVTEPGNIYLSAKAQDLSGLQTIILTPANHQAEFMTYGKSINIQPLIELRRQYFLALSQNQGAHAQFMQSEQNSKRQQGLYHDGASSLHNLQVQLAQRQTDKAQLDASQVQIQAITNELTLNWGKKLSAWAISTDFEPLSAFLSGKRSLLQITLPTDKVLADNISAIAIETSGNRAKAAKAELISAALQSDNTVQGVSYFFQTEAKHISSGMRIAAWIPEGGENRLGVIIPKSALIWHLDQAFVYLKTDGEHFSRRSIGDFLAMGEDYFVDSQIKAGEQLVITGGQLLLSEEFRNQIPNEDD